MDVNKCKNDACSLAGLVYIILVFVSMFIAASPCAATTLHERSQQQLAERVKAANPDDYLFIVMGDSRSGDAVFSKLLRSAVARKPVFILHLGDVSEKGSDPELEHFLTLVDSYAAGLPLFVAKGNHEKGNGYTRLIGPKNYAIEIPRLGLMVTVADNSRRELTDRSLERLRSDLSKPFKVRIVGMHYYPKTERQPNHVFEKGRDGYVALLRELQPALSLHGDIHLYDHEMIEGVPAYITGGAGAPLTVLGYPGNPVYHYLVIRVKSGKVSVEMAPLEESR